MHAMYARGTWVLLALLALAPGVVRAQPTYAPADPQLPIPIGSTRPEDGGLYTFANYVMYRQTNILKQQALAWRGFLTSDNTVPGSVDPQLDRQRTILVDLRDIATLPSNQEVIIDPATGQPAIQIPTGNPFGSVIFVGVLETLPPLPNPVATTLPVGTFVGSGQVALDVNQLTGQDSYQPGFDIGIGWKFKDGSSLHLSWMYLTETQYRAGATLAARDGAYGQSLENSFLYSPVFNFPPEFSGADYKILAPNTTNPPISAQAVFGIWNGASIQTIDFRQRVQQWELTYRTPIYETENYRLNGLVGPRFFWIWERFKWATTSLGTNPDGTVASGPWNVGLYSAVTSNRMYGAHVGCQQEWYLGHGFAFHWETQVALYLNSTKQRAKYETAAKYYGLPENKRAKREWSVVPEAQSSVGIMWYPTEFVQLYAAYEVMGFLNTFALRRPVDFDYANLAPHWSHTARLFDGLRAGVSFSF